MEEKRTQDSLKLRLLKWLSAFVLLAAIFAGFTGLSYLTRKEICIFPVNISL